MLPVARLTKPASTEFPLFYLTMKGIQILRGPRCALSILPFTPAIRQMFYGSWLNNTELPFLCKLHILVSDIMLIGAFRPGELLLADASTSTALTALKVRHISVEGVSIVDWGERTGNLTKTLARLAKELDSRVVEYWSVSLQSTKTEKIYSTAVHLTTAQNSDFKLLARFVASLREREVNGEILSPESPAFGYPVVEDKNLLVKFFTLPAFRSIDSLLMSPFTQESDMQVCPYSRRKGWATALAAAGNNLVNVRILLRHSIGNLKHYVKLKPTGIVSLQDKVLARWASGMSVHADFSLPVLIEISEVAVDDYTNVRNNVHVIIRSCAYLIHPPFPPPK